MGAKSSSLNKYSNDPILAGLLVKFNNSPACSEKFRDEFDVLQYQNHSFSYYEKMPRDQLVIEISKLLEENKRSKYIIESLMDYLRCVTGLIGYVKDGFLVTKV